MCEPLDAVQPVFTVPPPDSIPDGPEDAPKPGRPLDEIGPLKISSLVFGAASWSHFYNDEAHLVSDIPIRTIRLALRYGIKSFDTSPYYGPSEIVLGAALKALEAEFPRTSYQLITKCGRYGLSHFDYSPSTIRRSIERSLSRMNTPYLDVVYLHDVEYVAPLTAPRAVGIHIGAIGDEAALYGLAEGQEAKIRDENDEKILSAIAELRKMQDEGLIKNVGISGLPLPVLLRVALLVLHTPPYRPLDVVLSYTQLTLQNSTLLDFLPAFHRRARVKQVLSASPLSMALLTPKVPIWHPASASIREAAVEAARCCEGFPGGLPTVATGWAVNAAEDAETGPLPTVIGLSTPSEVHQAVESWRVAKDSVKREELQRCANKAIAAFSGKGIKDWTW